MLVTHYAEALSGRLPPALFRPVASRALWLTAHGAIVALLTIAILDGHLGVSPGLGLSILIALASAAWVFWRDEALHGLVVKPPWLRRCLGTLCRAPVRIGPVFWTIWHNIHHAHAQHPVKDPIGERSRVVPNGSGHGRAATLHRFASPVFPIFLATDVTGHARALLFGLQRQMDFATASGNTHGVPGSVGVLPVAGSLAGIGRLVVLLCAPDVVGQWDYHLFVVTKDFLNPLDDASLTVATQPWIENLLLNFNYHAEHHLFSCMSPRYAPQETHLLKQTWPDRYHQ